MEFNMTQEMKDYIINDLKATQQYYLNRKIKEFYSNTSKVAYILKLVTRQKIVVCERCYSLGHVDFRCNKCGGKGTHRKGYLVWEVRKAPVEIKKVDRDPESGVLRYWTSMSEFFYETVDLSQSTYRRWYDEDHNNYPNGVHFVHFKYNEAINEVNRLNKILEQRGVL